MRVTEVRTDCERIGNLILVDSDTKDTEGISLQNLWIEAQEYRHEIPDEQKESDFIRESRTFIKRKISIRELDDELTNVFARFEGIDYVSSIDLAEMRRHIMEISSLANEITVLEDGFADYSVYVSSTKARLFFAWTDVV